MSCCKICQKPFDSPKGLHHHLKAHDMPVNSYYMTYHPRFDLLTQKQIACKNWKDYLATDFVSYNNYLKWIDGNTASEASSYIRTKFEEKKKEKNLTHMPPDIFFFYSKMALTQQIEKYCGHYDDFCASYDLVPQFNQPLPQDFWNYEPQMEIWRDTREQKPIFLGSSRAMKLDFGDYTVGGDLYSKTFLERKSLPDFINTFGKDIDRFRREMERAKSFGAFMFVLVETDMKEQEVWKSAYVKSNNYFSYLFHNVKDLILEFPENLQILFTTNRLGSEKIGKKILWYGQKVWRVDLQKEINKRMKILC
jgi:hypothetical protein